MKFTLSWLKDHLETDASLEALCDKLTATGLEVEGVEDHGAALAPFKIAQIAAAEKHPNADRLRLCTVDTGKEKIQVVCGAPNARAGIKVVLARPGDVIPSAGEALKLSKIRGVESQGMMCSAAELKIAEEANGIIELSEDAPLGGSFVEYAKLGDPVIEINLTPNRADCAGVRGIARDLAAAGMGRLKELNIKLVKGTEDGRIKVSLEFPADQKNACPLFTGILIRNIKNGPSPAWMQQRLRAIGLRPISALVDITNYMTIDCARPLHVFDADKVKGNLWVRPAKGGETMEALNGKTYTLEAGMTVIGDDTGVLSLAGVMGGTSSSCDENTKNVFLESATFDPNRTAKTGRALQVTSDARYRFERGVDPAFVIPGAERAAQMILDLCGQKDTVVSKSVIAGAVSDTTRTISYDFGKCLQYAGVDVSADEQKKTLEALGFVVEKKGVKVPSWRGDVEGQADLVEEVIRIKGFDCVPFISMPRERAITTSALDDLDSRANTARRVLAANGLMEAVTWSFMSSAIAEQFGAIDPCLRLSNPISADLDVMRPSIFGNLISAATRNADRGYADACLFEVGPIFALNGQALVACAVRAGSTPRSWVEPSRNVDFYDAKADALAVLEACGIASSTVQFSADAPVWYHPGRSATIRRGNVVLGTVGELHPALLAACDASGPMAGCEILLENVPSPRNAGTAKPLLKLEALQPVSRDFAFIMSNDVAAEKLIKAIKSVDRNLITNISIFDVYAGDKIGAGKKSIALSVTLQPTDHTLTDSELEDISARIASAVTKATGAVLRG